MATRLKFKNRKFKITINSWKEHPDDCWFEIEIGKISYFGESYGGDAADFKAVTGDLKVFERRFGKTAKKWFIKEMKRFIK